MASQLPSQPSMGLGTDTALLEQVLRETPAGLVASTGPEHRLTFFNERFQLNTGGRARLGEPVAVCLPELVAQGFTEVLDQVYRSGQTYNSRATPIHILDPATQQLVLYYYDFTFQALREADGRVRGILAFAADVSAQVQARLATDQALVEQRAFYETLLAEAPVGIVAFDADHRYLFANPFFVPYAGFNEWMLGKTNVEACAARGYAPEVAARRDEKFDEALQQRQQVSWEETVVTPEGPQQWLRSMRPVFRPDGTLWLMVSAGLDITERRRAEARLREQQVFFSASLIPSRRRWP